MMALPGFSNTIKMLVAHSHAAEGWTSEQEVSTPKIISVCLAQLILRQRTNPLDTTSFLTFNKNAQWDNGALWAAAKMHDKLQHSLNGNIEFTVDSGETTESMGCRAIRESWNLPVIEAVESRDCALLIKECFPQPNKDLLRRACKNWQVVPFDQRQSSLPTASLGEGNVF